MADRLIEMRAAADMPGTSMRIASEDLRAIVARIDAQAAEIERLRAALYSVDRQLGHDDADDALRDEITAALEEQS